MNIEADIEGQRVTGCITYRTKRGLTVEITSPYQGLSTHLTIPYFAAAYSSFDGAHGMETADEMLRNLYLTADYIAKHRERLAKELELQQSQQEWAFVKGHLPPSAMSCDVQQVLASIRR